MSVTAKTTHVAFDTGVRVRLFEGPSGSGKTHRLVSSARQFLAAGTSDTRMLFVCASAQGAKHVRNALGDELPQAVRIVSATELAMDVLADERVTSITRRTGRLLLPFEERFLMQDLETCGVRPKRLREMVKFFRHGWADLDDLAPDWLVTNEEHVVHDLLKDDVRFMGGVLAEEAPNLAVRALVAQPSLRAALGADVVLADDYLQMSRASQCLIYLLAYDELIVAGNTTCTAALGEAYPNPLGFSELEEGCSDVTRTVLEYHGACLASRLSARLLDAPVPVGSVTQASVERAHPNSDIVVQHGLTELVGRSVQDETRLVADFVRQRIDQGVNPSEIYVASPHKDWTRSLARLLGREGIKAEVALEPRSLMWPVQDDRRNSMARAITLLALCANPGDNVALRSWLGLGLPLCNSGGIRHLRNAYEGKLLAEALALELELPHGKEEGEPLTNETLELADIALRMDELQRLLKDLRPLEGDALLRAIARASASDGQERGVADLLGGLCEPYGGSAEASCGDGAQTAAALFDNAYRRVTLPMFERDDAVRIGSYAGVYECGPEVVVLTGFVGGFAPERDVCDGVVLEADKRALHWKRGLRVAYLAASCARKELACSYFEQAGLEEAERYKLKIDRVRVKNGTRVAAIPVSPWIYYLR